MKKSITTVLLAASLIAQPAMAHERRYNHHHSRDNTSGIIAGIMGGIILGAIIASDRGDDRRDDRRYRERDDYYDNDYVQSRPPRAERRDRCYYINYQDYYGTWTSRRVCD